ncbi:MAG: hemerythrin family protein [Bacteroidales bacterium]|nr:hemerythrin family protein [Bacteroidales bacterium]
MALFEWSNDLSVKIDTIDCQHQKLIGMISEFYEMIKNKSANDLVSKLIKNMKEYTVIHFSHEEKYFEQYNYIHKDEHIKEHKLFVEKVKDLETRYNAGKVILSFEITNFLKTWLTNHIQVTDKKYSDFLISKGAK